MILSWLWRHSSSMKVSRQDWNGQPWGWSGRSHSSDPLKWVPAKKKDLFLLILNNFLLMASCKTYTVDTTNLLVFFLNNGDTNTFVYKINFLLAHELHLLTMRSVVPKLFWCADHLKYFCTPISRKYWPLERSRLWESLSYMPIDTCQNILTRGVKRWHLIFGM